MDRRSFLLATAGGLVLSQHGRGARAAGLPDGAIESGVLDALPGKAPLIKRSFRPPNYETPVEYFDQAITPNRAFFVRWHLTDIPEVNPTTWRLKVVGPALNTPLEYSLDELKRGFDPVELVAVCQCSGSRRGLSDPHVPGVEWGYGAVGNARWKGVRLRDVLNKAGLAKAAIEIAFDGADQGANPATPDFRKSIPVAKALDENSLLAWEMNGEPLPHMNGAPLRLIVPGWTATYWIKMITTIEARDKPLETFWMNTAYRVPKGKFAFTDRFLTQESDTSTPITEMVVNSVITSVKEGDKIAVGRDTEVRGVAWDGGFGIRDVTVSIDGGRTWTMADLGEDLGRFSFRMWKFRFRPDRAGAYVVMARAANRQGMAQAFDLVFNPPGYHNNVMQKITLNAA